MEDFIQKLRETVLILTYSLFILTPLIFYKHTTEIFEFNKLITIYLFTTFIFGLSFIINPKKIYLNHKVFYAVLIFTIVQMLGVFITIDRWTSFFGYYGRFNGGVLSSIYYFLLFYSLIFTLNKKQLLKLLQLSALTSVFVSIIGILSKYNIDLICYVLSNTITNTCWTENFKPAERIFSTLGQPNWLANYLGVNLVFLSYLIAKSKNKRSLIIYLIFLAVNSIALIFTRSLTGQFAMIVSVFMFLVLGYLNKKIAKPNLNYLLITIILILAIFTDKSFITERIRNLTDLSQDKSLDTSVQINQTEIETSEPITDSGKIRLIVWKGAWELFKRYPVFGTGPETFGISYFFTRPAEHNMISEWNYIYNKAHNEFLNYLATEGIIGFSAYIALVIMPMIISLYSYLKTKNLFYLVIAAGFLNININNFTGFSTTTTSLYIFLLNAALIIYDKNQSNQKHFITNIKTTASVVFMFISIYLIQLLFRADLLYEQGLQAKKQSDFITAQNSLLQASKLLSHPNYQTELSSAKAQLYLLVTQLNEDETNTAIEIYDISKNKIKEINESAINKSPYNIIYKKNAGRNAFYFYQADLQKSDLEYGIKQLEQAHKIAPTEISSFYMYNFLKFLYYQDNKDKLTEIKNTTMKQLIALKPDYIPSHLLYSKYVLLTESKEQAIKYLEEVNKKLNNPDITNEINSLESL